MGVTTRVIIFITKYNKDNCVELDKILNIYDKFIIVKTEHNLYEKYAINNYKKYINDFLNDQGVKLIWNIIYIIFTQKDAEIYKKFRRRIHSVHYYDSVVVLVS